MHFCIFRKLCGFLWVITFCFHQINKLAHCRRITLMCNSLNRARKHFLWIPSPKNKGWAVQANSQPPPPLQSRGPTTLFTLILLYETDDKAGWTDPIPIQSQPQLWFCGFNPRWPSPHPHPHPCLCIHICVCTHLGPGIPVPTLVGSLHDTHNCAVPSMPSRQRDKKSPKSPKGTICTFSKTQPIWGCLSQKVVLLHLVKYRNGPPSKRHPAGLLLTWRAFSLLGDMDPAVPVGTCTEPLAAIPTPDSYPWPGP